MREREMKMRRFVCDDYPIDNLPRDLHPQLPTGRRVRVVIEDEISEAELREELEAEIAKGLRSLDEGRSLTADEVMAGLRARFGTRAAAAE
jgi:predicted transcriptional regulator